MKFNSFNKPIKKEVTTLPQKARGSKILHLKLLRLLGILGLSSIVFLPKTAQSLELPINSGVTIQSYPKKSTIWANKTINVCWENSQQEFNGFSTEREWVKNEIANTWEYQSLVRFVGWERCATTQNPDIRILISDARPHTNGLGNKLRSKSNGMVLNFAFNSWTVDGLACPTTDREYCIRVIAVHEFGHALGFAHEQNRTDKPSWCREEQEQGPDGDTFLGAWDLESVMNYCNPEYAGNGSLSATDIAAVQAYYGKPPEKSASVTSVVRGNRIDVFLVGNDGAVWSTGWDGSPSADQAKRWVPVSNPGTAPTKSVVTSVVRGNQVDLFVLGKDGAVWSTGWDSFPTSDQAKRWVPVSNRGTAPI